VRLSEKVVEALREADPEGAEALVRSLEAYPSSVIEILIYHRLHFHMSPGAALTAFERLRTEFVDWNELRVSPIREIQEQLRDGVDSLELSVFVKDLLEQVHSDRHKIDLDSILEGNLSDIRKHLKQVRDVEPSSIELVLLLRKLHPVVPLSEDEIALLTSLGLVKDSDTLDRKMKVLHDLIGADAAHTLHHLTLEVCRRGKTTSDEPAGAGDVTRLETIAKFVGSLTGKTVKVPTKKRVSGSGAKSSKGKSAKPASKPLAKPAAKSAKKTGIKATTKSAAASTAAKAKSKTKASKSPSESKADSEKKSASKK
jgi:hypothetical protein